MVYLKHISFKTGIKPSKAMQFDMNALTRKRPLLFSSNLEAMAFKKQNLG